MRYDRGANPQAGLQAGPANLVLSRALCSLDALRRVTVNLPLAALLTLGAAPAAAETKIAEFSGTESRNTGEFEVDAPWILDWRVSNDGARDSAVEVTLEAAGLGTYEGRVLMTKSPGSGVRLFRNSGRFYFRVDASFSRWTLKVIELTEEEAARYTPRSSAPLD